MKKSCIVEISLVIALIVSVLLPCFSFASDCRDIRNDVLRLHILANSDSEEDQNVKLMVRDALLSSGDELFEGEINKLNAEKKLSDCKSVLVETANRILKENGFSYTADIYISEEYFTTRSYEEYTLPAGEYTALKVVLGEGKGHNWWCVMFPPLCLPAATDDAQTDLILGTEGSKIIQSNPKYEIRFKIIELLEELKYKIHNRV